mgnify:CR=1 FL=1
MNTHISFKKRGFTLTETVIAIGVVALLITSFIAVFGPARNQIQNVIAREEADRLLESLENEMRTLRPGETYANSFNKAFDWVQGAESTEGAIFLYNYRADPSVIRPSDESLGPVASTSAISGQEAITLPAIRRNSDPLFQDDATAIQGRVYYVKLTQLVFDGQGQMVENPGGGGIISDPETGNPIANPDDYPSAAIALRADFYVLPSKDINYINNNFDASTYTNPVFSRNIAILR